jgi:membrane-associated phospholipid phosphatase
VTFLLAIHDLPVAFTVAAVVFVALTRVYIGDHWPSDVLAGALLGAGVAALARSIHSRR